MASNALNALPEHIFYKKDNKESENCYFIKEKNITLVRVLRQLQEHFNCNESLLNNICEQIINTTKKYYFFDIPENKYTFSIEWDIKGGNITTNIFTTGLFDDFPFLSEYFNIIVENLEIKKVDVNFSRDETPSPHHRFFSDFEFAYNNNFNIHYFREIYVDWVSGVCQNIIFDNQLTNDEIFKNIKIKLNMSEQINTLLPEIVNDSAYDFNSEDFKNRLLLAEILSI